MSTNQQSADILLQQGLLPASVIETLLQRADERGQWLGQLVIEHEMLSDDELAQSLSVGSGIPLIRLNTVQPDPAAMACLTPEVCRQYCMVPVSLTGNTLQLAIANPFAETTLDAMRTEYPYDIVTRIAPINAIRQAILEWYQNGVSSMPSGEIPANPRDTLPKRQAAEPSVENDCYPMSLDDLLVAMLHTAASDLHLTVGAPPLIRVNGELRKMPFPVLAAYQMKDLVYPILTDTEIRQFEQRNDLDLAYSLPSVARFRVNVFRQRGSVCAIMRPIPHVPTLEELEMPPILHELTMRPRGLVLVTGPTGAGKSTTIAAMINQLNMSRKLHIITLEDPIEFTHEHKLCEVNQRQIGLDTDSYAVGLRQVLRQDPDVIFIGEMRDYETITAALTAAETGHLVLSTLHTSGAAQTISRIIDVVQSSQQDQILKQLAAVLEAVISQTLIPGLEGNRRYCAQEILVTNAAIRNLIRENKIHLIPGVMQSSGRDGMQTLDQALITLVKQHKISAQDALLQASHPDDFRRLLAMG
jgi:twitching motility protein PilT